MRRRRLRGSRGSTWRELWPRRRPKAKTKYPKRYGYHNSAEQKIDRDGQNKAPAVDEGGQQQIMGKKGRAEEEGERDVDDRPDAERGAGGGRPNEIKGGGYGGVGLR